MQHSNAVRDANQLRNRPVFFFAQSAPALGRSGIDVIFESITNLDLYLLHFRSMSGLGCSKDLVTLCGDKIVMIAIYARTIVLTLLALLVVGCGGNSAMLMTPSPTATPCVASATPAFAYLLNDDSVSTFTANSCTGAFTSSGGAVPTFPSAVGSEDMVVDRQGKFLYVANLVSNVNGPSAISMYTINPSTGLLTPTNPPTIQTGWFPQGIAIDPAGKFVYTANSDDNTVSMFTVDRTTGLLTPTTPPAVPSLSDPGQITVDPSGRFVYVANGFGTVGMFTIDTTSGLLTPMSPAAVHAGGFPFELAVSPSGKFLYVVDNLFNHVAEFTIDQVTGMLTPTARVFASTGQNPTAVTVDPASKFAYVTNRLDNTISMYTIDANSGELTALGVIPTGSTPFHLSFDPAGKFLYVINENGPASIYTVDNTTGKLVPNGNTAAASLQLAMH
jgi:6-phosphogluconolactonase (cycloisomerase 2 family)